MMYLTYFFLKSYLTTFIFIAAGAMFILFLGLYLIYVIHFKKTSAERVPHKNLADVSAISGDNVIATQLDLARAYIEMGKNDLARYILNGVATQGSIAQQNEARTLLGLI